MPTTSNHDRALFYPSNDLAYAFSRNRVFEVLSSWHGSDIESINDCIEAHQCKLVLEEHKHLFPDEQFEDLSRNANTLFGEACKRASSLIKSVGMADLYEDVEFQYRDRLWSFIASGGLYGGISETELSSFLLDHPFVLRSILECRVLVNEFDECLTKALEQNHHYAAQLIIGTFGSKSHSPSEITLPSKLSNESIDQIMLRYIAEEDASLNYVSVLASWPQSAKQVYRPSGKVLVDAGRRASELSQSLLKGGSAVSVTYGEGVTFSPDQIACKSVSFDDDSLVHTYSTKWLMDHVDPGTILNNFIYVFEFIDCFGMLAAPAHKHEQSTLFQVLGLHPRDEYPRSMQFISRNEHAMLVVFAYRKLLLEAGTRLEDAIEWFFNTYIEEEFGVKGFSVSLPTEETSYLDKCKAIGPEIERALKAHELYVKYGEIDAAYFPHMRIKQFDSLPSSIENKYLIESEGYLRYAQMLFSDQSLLAYSEAHEGFDDFFSMVANGGVSRNDFQDFCQPAIDDLVNGGFVDIGEGSVLSISTKAYFLKGIWDEGAIPAYRLSDEESAVADALVEEGLLCYSKSLFTPDESDYMNYMFNDAKFSNPIALRNKYLHASGVVDDPGSQIIEQDYCRLLALLIMVALKINDELSFVTGKGGVEDFVDWPLVDLEQLQTMLKQLSR